MSIPIQFFQTGSAIIPALLVAMAVSTGAQGQKFADAIGRGEISRWRAVFGVLILALAVSAGELSGFIGIVDAETMSQREAVILSFSVLLAVFLCLQVLAFELLGPTLKLLSPGWKFILYWGVILIFVAGFVTAIIQVFQHA